MQGNNKSKKKKLKGFTLIELLIVIAIIGIITSIIIVSLSSATFRSRDSKTVAQFSQIPNLLELYYTDNGTYTNICSSETSLSANSGLLNVQIELSSRGKTIECYAEDNNYCISSQLNTGEYYLVKNNKRFTSAEGCTSATTGGGLGEGNIAIEPITWVSCGDNITFTYNGSSVTYGTVEIDYGGGDIKCWLDRNLGATSVAQSSTDSDAYGDLFQWGRLDDGHQVRTSGLTSTRNTTDTPGHSNFITHNSSPYDWRNPQNDNLWQGVNGTNNPCPNGFRIPTETELEIERGSWSTNNSAGAFASPLKFTLAGYRSYSFGSLNNVGSSGTYWSSTVSGANSRSLTFNSSGASMFSGYRAYGLAVRCLKDE